MRAIEQIPQLPVRTRKSWQPDNQAIFFWTFLDGAVMNIERARLRARDAPNNA
jgi:hypothetical protein